MCNRTKRMEMWVWFYFLRWLERLLYLRLSFSLMFRVGPSAFSCFRFLHWSSDLLARTHAHQQTVSISPSIQYLGAVPPASPVRCPTLCVTKSILVWIYAVVWPLLNLSKIIKCIHVWEMTPSIDVWYHGKQGTHAKANHNKALLEFAALHTDLVKMIQENVLLKLKPY